MQASSLRRVRQGIFTSADYTHFGNYYFLDSLDQMQASSLRRVRQRILSSVHGIWVLYYSIKKTSFNQAFLGFLLHDCYPFHHTDLQQDMRVRSIPQSPLQIQKHGEELRVQHLPFCTEMLFNPITLEAI